MRAKFFHFQFVMKVLYKLRNFKIQNNKEKRKQKFRKSKNRDFQFNKFQNQIPHKKSKISPENLEFLKTIFSKKSSKNVRYFIVIYITKKIHAHTLSFHLVR
ncbi:hypothetical protein BK718_35715 [Bacillus thuringiensis serovar andalousiensis]|nr:hypothetical protein BK718_35715 [Bacillus thuringiensis serovar andalousiensis]